MSGGSTLTSIATIKELVEFGLNDIPQDLTVSVSVRDLVYVHQTLGELNRFFHQPAHYPTLDSVNDFLTGNGGAYEVLREAYYTKLANMLPEEIQEKLHDGLFDSDKIPKYFHS
jgi:hypothetical protein